MLTLSIGLIITSVLCMAAGLFWKRARAFLFIGAFFASLNSYIAAPLNWASLLAGHGFFLTPIVMKTPPIPSEQLALPTDTPQTIIKKMGCYVCHKIPYFGLSRESEYGPVLITGSTAHLTISSPEYQKQIKKGRAEAKTPREYIKESILDPSAYIVPGYEDPKFPEISPMYRYYAERFTPGGLDALADYLLTLTAEDAMEDGLIMGHR